MYIYIYLHRQWRCCRCWTVSRAISGSRHLCSGWRGCFVSYSTRCISQAAPFGSLRSRCVAVCCSVLQCVAVCCSVLQCVFWLIQEYAYLFVNMSVCFGQVRSVETHEISQEIFEKLLKSRLDSNCAIRCMDCVAACCSVLQCVAVYCSVLPCVAVYSIHCRADFWEFFCFFARPILRTRCVRYAFTATHCNTLQHTAIHCNTLQHSATHCNTLQQAATHCNTLQRTATHCTALQHTATHWSPTEVYYGNSLCCWLLRFFFLFTVDRIAVTRAWRTGKNNWNFSKVSRYDFWEFLKRQLAP